MMDQRAEPPVKLDYAPEPQRRGWKARAATFLARLSRPMPLAMYYLIMFVLSVIALVLALIATVIVRAFQSSATMRPIRVCLSSQI